MSQKTRKQEDIEVAIENALEIRLKKMENQIVALRRRIKTLENKPTEIIRYQRGGFNA